MRGGIGGRVLRLQSSPCPYLAVASFIKPMCAQLGMCCSRRSARGCFM